MRKRQQALSARNQRRGNRTRSGSSWYFYSQTAKQRGQAAFEQKWGSRKLNDYWRLSNKQTGGFEGIEEEKAEKEDPKEQYSKTNRKYYTQDIPLSDSAKKATHDMIKEAYFNVGMVYMNDLENFEKAIESFKTLNSKYPDSSFELPSYYHMYKMFKEKGDHNNADRYKQKIIAEYPESNYAKVVSDPDYFKKLEKKQNVLEQKYSDVLNKYKNGRYFTAINDCDSLINKYDNKPYLARFNYVKALAIGKTQDLVSFRKALKHVTKNYPDTEVARAANNKLNFLEKTELQQISSYFAKNKEKQQAQQSQEKTAATKNDSKQEAKPQEEPEEQLYRFREDDSYYFVIIASTDNIDINKLKFDLINFNLDYYLQKDYTTTSKTFNEHNTIISVKRFKDLKAIKEYYDIISKKEQRVFKEIDEKYYEYFYISVKNYPTLLEKKTIIEYLKFFKNKLVDRKTN
jgi:TolA-binding protein